MREIIIIAIAIGAIVFFLRKKDSEPQTTEESNKPSKFYSLNDGNQNELTISADVNIEWLDSIKAKYDWNEYDEYDNRMWEYMYKLFDETVEKSGVKSSDELWDLLNRKQKVFWAYLAFNGDTDNGGVYQFIFNKPKFIIAVAEMWEELEVQQINTDYQDVLSELNGKTSTINSLKEVFNDDSKNWEKRWTSFADGYKELKTTERIEDYYYNTEYKKQLHKKVADYIETNIDMFVAKK